MSIRRNPEFDMLERDFGIYLPDAQQYLEIGMDAAPTNLLQSQMISTVNAGIPAILTTIVDPNITRILTTPVKAAAIFGSAKHGDYTTTNDMFPVVEGTGEVSTYGDYDNNGSAGANIEWEQRQSYHFQTICRWGDKALDMAAKGKINYANEVNLSAAHVISKAHNKIWFFGVQGLQNYGILNEPNLSPALAPTGSWQTITGIQIINDINSMFVQLQKQLPDSITTDSKMKLVMSSITYPALTKPAVLESGGALAMSGPVLDYLKKVYKNLEIETATEYSTSAGELVQLVCLEVEGQEVGHCGFTELSRAHAIVRDTSSQLQKKSAGNWGFLLKLPGAISQMIGV